MDSDKDVYSPPDLKNDGLLYTLSIGQVKTDGQDGSSGPIDTEVDIARGFGSIAQKTWSLASHLTLSFPEIPLNTHTPMTTVEKAVKSLKQNAPLDEVLAPRFLDPAVYTYGYMYILHFKVTSTDIKDHHVFVDQARELMTRGDGQIRLVWPGVYVHILLSLVP